MGSPAAFNPKKPNEGMFGNYKGSPKKLLNEFKKAKSKKGELEGLRSVIKKYNIKPKYTYSIEAGLLAKEKEEEQTKKKSYKLSKKSLLGT